MSARCLPAASAACAVAVAGCGHSSVQPGPSAARVVRDTSAVAMVAAAPPAAQQVAIAYTQAARFTTPRTLRANGARQQHLATTGFTRRLARFAPTAADVDQAVIDGAATNGQIVDRASMSQSHTAAVVVLSTAELQAGSAATALVVSRVLLARTPHGWRVTAFTVLPKARTAHQGLTERETP